MDHIDSFYNRIDQFFVERINNFIKKNKIETNNLENLLDEVLDFIKPDFLEMGFEQDEIENKFLDLFLEINPNNISSIHEIYDIKLAPIIYEIFLEKVADYLVDINVNPIMLNLKSKDFLSLEFIIELRNLKDLINKYPEKKENLRKYIQIQDRFVNKLIENKKRIEILEDLNDPKEKLQILYLINRIINFFHLEKRFDFSHIEEYLKNNVSEWLISIPLVTLKNPDLYFCGIYLAKSLNLTLDNDRIKKFLMDLFEEGLDEFEAPLVQATDGVYYLLKTTHLMKLWLTNSQINRLIEVDSKYFEQSYLKNLETSQLVVILKIYNFLHTRNIEGNVHTILEELENRITPEGIKQYRNGFISSEASYYVLFCNYMRNSLDKIKEFDLLSSIISKIYRNLELLEFSADMNFDLISELFYALEILKLFNCIETREMIIHLTKHLFPQEVVESIKNNQEVVNPEARFRHFKVDRITGETNY
ncbi:MAG: hypothetical protein ACTSV5_04485 [Promethearchaeota archaeon]